MNIAERGEYWSRWHPDSIAIKVAEQEITWAALTDSVRRVAGGLRQRRIEPGDRVAIHGGNSAEWCVVALAALHVGAIVVPVNLRFVAAELQYVIEHAGCTALAYGDGFGDLCEQVQSGGWRGLSISLAGDGPADIRYAQLAASEPMPCATRRPDDAAVIGYTSGTTGFPKGATLTHANLHAAAMQWAVAENSLSERRTLLPVPLAFTGGIVNNFLSTYIVGGTLVLEREFVPDRMLRILVEERISFFAGVPIMWQGVASAAGFQTADLSALTTAVCGGARVNPDLLKAFLAKGVVLRQAYALTEACGSVCLLPKQHALTKISAAGIPNADTRIRLIDRSGEDISRPREVGEILVQGPQVMAGYWDDEEASTAALHDGWLLTGDMGCFDEEGFLEVVDRLKAMFISGGINVYPAEIERIVDAHPEVAESCAFGVEHERFGEACALVVRGDRGRVDEAALLSYCRDQLADYKTPRQIVQTDQPLPRGMSGKIQREAVKARYG